MSESIRRLCFCGSIIAVIVCVTMPAPAQIPPHAGYNVEVPIIGDPGDLVSATHRITTQYPTFDGFGFSICNDPDELQPIDVEPGTALPTDAVGFFYNWYLEPGGAGLACILDGFGAVSLPIGVGHHITTVHYQVVGGTPDEDAMIDYCELADPASGGAVVYSNWLTHEGTTLLPELVIGFPQFKRGDGNADGVLDIADVIFGLSGLFTGGPWGVCQDSMDADDDGVVNIGDPIYTLMYLFTPGSIPPPSPFPQCGSDPTPDVLDCNQSTEGC
ncbi:MAG: hypothetical protein VX764_09105 [Planctomycetota bacterium]|nr:hypothetical protein [Planctomycetota bacterium]